MRRPMRRTAESFKVTNDGIEYMGEITCEVTGEWAEKVKVWTEVDNPNGNQYSLIRMGKRFLFILEAVN